MISWWSGPTELGLVALLSALGIALGLWSTVLARGPARTASRLRETALPARIAHSLRDISAAARAELTPRVSDPLSIAGVVLSPAWRRVVDLTERLIGVSAEDIVVRAGVSYGIEEHRLRRVGALIGGGALGVALGAALALGGMVNPLVALVLAITGGVGGLGLYDRQLRQMVKNRQERLLEEFPTVLELLALALSAGDSLPGAIRRIAQRGQGDLATEWARVMRMVDVGAPLGPTLVQSARSLGVPEIEALAEHLGAALERGAPLAEVVRAHSSDSRLQRLRAIVDRAGKAEVAMLVPLVLLILPITVLFAVWPSLQALELNL